MKALKYGLALVLGLSMLSFGVQAFAQASGQTQEVTPANPNTLPEVPATVAMGQPDPQAAQSQRGVVTPKQVEDLIMQREFAKAVETFEKFMKTAQGDACNLIYLRYTFYDRLMEVDRDQVAAYKVKRDASIVELEKNCPNMADLYVLKVQLYGEGKPDSVVKWLDKAIELDPTYAISYGMRADALWLLQEDEKACADYKKAAELNDQPARMRYAERCANRETDNK